MASVLKWVRRGALALVGLLILLLGTGWVWESWSETSDLKRFTPPGILVDVGGRKMYLDCAGNGAPTVVLEPGAGEFSLLVEPLQHRIAAFTRVCSYDRAGFGWSDPAAAGRSFDARAADLDLLLRKANIDGPYVLVGASYGGLLVRSYARQHPDSVAGMVLVDSAEEQLIFTHMQLMHRATSTLRLAAIASRFGITRLALQQLANQAKAQGRIATDVSPAAISAAITLSVRPSAWRTSLDEATAYDATPPSERVAGGFGTLGNRPLIVLRHGKPFSGINGALAQLEPSWAEAQARLAALSTNSRLVVAKDQGHDIMMENPTFVANAVRVVVEAVRGVRKQLRDETAKLP